MTGGDDTGGARLRLYGRRVGPRLRAAQARRVEVTRAELNLAARPRFLAEPQRLFDEACRSVWLDIGFGGGEHLIWQALRNPDVGLIGCEAFLNGVAKVLAVIERENLGNIRIHHGDARDVLDLLGDATLDRVFLLYPDPWPKRRHWKRRFVNAANLASLHRVLRPGGDLCIASDMATYIAWTLTALHRHGGFEWCAKAASDWRQRPGDWLKTRYEEKAMAAGRRSAYLNFRRRPD
jgi:tRNA (guanine-N7-)-methyltransferase